MAGIAKDTSLARAERRRAQIPGSVFVRRRSEYLLVTDITASTLTSGYTFGATADVSEYNELIVEIIGNSLTIGSGAGLTARVELLSYKNLSYFPLPSASFTNPTATLTPAAGTSTIAAFAIPAPFGAMMRVGLAATTAFTSGTISVALHLKG